VLHGEVDLIENHNVPAAREDFFTREAKPVTRRLDVARAVARRTERRVAEMRSKEMLQNLKILEYLNRLSDVLYLLAFIPDLRRFYTSSC
jgi:cob(I)alamin adenosyltransferase